MRHSKFFLFAIVSLAIGLFLEMQDFVYSQNLLSGYTVSPRPELWNQTIAESVNQKTIYLTIDGKAIDLKKNSVYMDDMLSLMLPVSMLKDYFNCTAYVYENQKLVIQQGEVQLTMNVSEYSININGNEQKLTSTLSLKEGEFYIPVEVLQKGLNCQYLWDISTNSASIINVSAERGYIPSYYDYRTVFRDPLVKDQGKYGTCWAFASLTALESSLLPEEELDFSEDHMTLNNSFSSTPNDGGEYTMAMAYLASWRGPVLEADDPYGDSISPDGLKAVRHVQEVQVIEGKDFDMIKEMVFKYGGVQSSLYTSLTSSSSRSEYYNAEKSAYCYIGTEKPNHDVVIIGWDDNYPKENFKIGLEANGAFICRNSWGSSFGENGTFYVSYYDTNIGIHNVVYTKIEEADNYDTIYQSDLCGWVGQVGYSKDRGFFANVYQTKSKEKLQAVSFYAVGKNTEYEIYIVRDFQDSSSLNDRTFIQSGKFLNAGYYTVPLRSGIVLEAGERFAVVVKIMTPNAERPIAIEYAEGEATKDVDLSDGEGYISLYGQTWESAEESQECNVCLKVFTNRAD